MTNETTKQRELISRGVMVQPRFPRAVHRKIREAATAEGLSVTSWIRRLVCVALAEREEKKT